MTAFDDHVRAISGLGFGERQTRFMTLVALHGGFCLRRQYAAFAGLRYGAGVRDFLDRLVTRRLARRFDFRPDRGHVYHLHNSSIYDAIGQGDNRNRRRASPALVARKLMLLDFVLQHPDTEWYATEADKVGLFTHRFGVPRSSLPRRVYPSRQQGAAPTVRHFVHKLPIGLTGASAVPSFVYLATDTVGRAFTRFVQDHLPLLNHLTAWRIIAVAPRHIPGLTACEQAFKQLDSARVGVGDLLPDLEAYLAVREGLERDDLRHVSIAQLAQFRKMRSRFAAVELDSLYEQWRVKGPGLLRTPEAVALLGQPVPSRGALVTYELPVRYDRFGTFAGIV